MTFTYPWILHFLWIIPLATLNFIISERRRRKASERFAAPGLLCRLIGEERKGSSLFKNVLLLSAMALMLLALAGPRWGSHYQEIRRRGVDIMILMDVSASMSAQDIYPTRLERAEREVRDFLHLIRGDRVGLIAFAGAALIQCPLTFDHSAFLMFLDLLQPDFLPVPGTDLGAAIETAISCFNFKAETDKVIFFITDGEDHEGRGLKTAQKAAEKGVKIFVLGMGEPSGAPIPDGEDPGTFKKDPNGNLILSKLDEEALKAIADTTGGVYVKPTIGDADLEALYFNGIKSKTKDTSLDSGRIKVLKQRFALFLCIAVFFLVLEGLISDRNQAPVFDKK